MTIRDTRSFLLVRSFELIYSGAMRKKRLFQSPDEPAVRRLCESLQCSRVIATVLVNRGIDSTPQARQFLNPAMGQLRAPFGIKDMDRAVTRIAAAVVNREQVLVFGDYDVDGVTATVLFYEFLKSLGASVRYYIPHRINEGYGLQKHHINDIALTKTTNLIITADCGSSSHEAIRTAAESGIDVVVTDHHNVPATLPEAVAVVNPKRHDCTADFDILAGVGVAYTVIICLRKQLRDMNFWKDRQEPNLKHLSDIVALGTVADQVPLIKENRILTKIGLDQIKIGRRPGITALVHVSGRQDVADADDIAFRLAPRLNAAGRLDHAKMAVDLLTTDSRDSAVKIADALNELNTTRQITERKMLADIDEYITNHPELLEKSTIVLSHPAWHEGILGIAAARVVEQHLRPVVLISTRNGVGKGSARSIPGFDIHQTLNACERMIERFGGHPMAAGLTIREDNIERFQHEFDVVVRKLGDVHQYRPMLTIDYDLTFNQITPRLLDELELLSPFGSGNPEPLFRSRDIHIVSHRIVGKNHRQMTLRQTADPENKRIKAIQFNIDPKIDPPAIFETMVFHLRWNRWNGNKTVQIIVVDV